MRIIHNVKTKSFQLLNVNQATLYNRKHDTYQSGEGLLPKLAYWGHLLGHTLLRL